MDLVHYGTLGLLKGGRKKKLLFIIFQSLEGSRFP